MSELDDIDFTCEVDGCNTQNGVLAWSATSGAQTIATAARRTMTPTNTAAG